MLTFSEKKRTTPPRAPHSSSKSPHHTPLCKSKQSSACQRCSPSDTGTPTCTTSAWNKSDCGRLNVPPSSKTPNASQSHYASKRSIRGPSNYKSPNAANLGSGCTPTCVMRSMTSPASKASITPPEQMNCMTSVTPSYGFTPPRKFMTPCKSIQRT
jgi:hypothetical protein